MSINVRMAGATRSSTWDQSIQRVRQRARAHHYVHRLFHRLAHRADRIHRLEPWGEQDIGARRLERH